MLPILHLNGYKIANPTVLARISQDELESLFRGHGYKPHFLEGSKPFDMHQRMAATLDTISATFTFPFRSAPAKKATRNGLAGPC